MPVTFPTYDRQSGQLRDVEYYSLDELADMLHMAPATAYNRAMKDKWPCLRTNQGRRWYSPEDIGAILDMMRENDRPPEDDGTALGIPIPPDPWLREDTDPGGVR